MSKVLAHRGFSGKYPENTMLAFEKALEIGCDGIEFDVQLTNDGVPVLIHDETIDRTTNGTGQVVSYAYNDLKKFNAASTYAKDGIVTYIPKLEELFDLIKNTDHLLNIELKNSILPYDGMEQKVIDLIRQYGLEEQCVLASFNHESVVKCREMAPEIKGSLITSSVLYDPVEYLKRAGITGLQCEFNSLTGESVKLLQDNGIALYPWTPNSIEEIQNLYDYGVDYIITNNVDKFQEVCNK